MRRAFVAIVTVLLAAPPAMAQSGPGICFNPQPAERCSGFPLIEVGAHYRLTDVFPDDERVMIIWKLGAMKNTGPRTAFGAEVFAALEGEFRLGAALRWRRWLGDRTSFDVAAGFHLAGEASSGSVVAGSPSIEARISSYDFLAATARFDLLRIRNADPGPCCGNIRSNVTSPRLYTGIAVGSWGGVVGYAATGVLFVIALIVIGNNYAY